MKRLKKKKKNEKKGNVSKPPDEEARFEPRSLQKVSNAQLETEFVCRGY